MTTSELSEFLNEKADYYENPDFISSDPIQIVHQFERKQDIEICGLLTATIAWGQRKSIIANAQKMVDIMEGEPYRFITEATDSEMTRSTDFVHRTFNHIDLVGFFQALKALYQQHNSLEPYFCTSEGTAQQGVYQFRNEMIAAKIPARSHKHISNPMKNSAAKRLNMFLRWMCRPNAKGVDFGLWSKFPLSSVMIPLDVHTGNVARKLGLITRKQNDWKALEELMTTLKQFDSKDPGKYDFALFGLGAFEKF
jgi:uncharacterized protein (TIGR02757 family)